MAPALNASELPAWSEIAASWPRVAEPPRVDIVIPAYDAPDLLEACLRHVFAAASRTPVNVVVIDDASPDPAVATLLGELAALGLLEFRRNEANLGFPATCNAGMALHPDRDVILLNTDAEVHRDWVDRLCRAAAPARVFTVTPLTNNGEICSYPVFLRDNVEPLELSDGELDQLASEVNAGIAIEAPTGVGFCMFLKRAALDEVGVFDVEAFDRGYGEENDLCRRAITAGWTNVIAADVFVRHHGGQSFGTEKVKRIEAAMRVLDEKHPGYHESVRRFIEADPVGAARQALDAARVKRRNGGRAFLMVAHTRGGGTERHVQELVALLEGVGTAVLTCRSDPYDPRHFRIEDPLLEHTPNLPIVDLANDPTRLGDLLRDLGVCHAHVHNLADYDPSAPEHLWFAFGHAGITYDVTVHDYQSMCPRINLVDVTGVFCGEPGVDTCQRCVDLMGSDFGRPTVWSWRQRHGRLLRDARAVFAPSLDAAKRIQRYLPGLEVVVRLHPELTSPARPASDQLRRAVAPADRSRLRIGMLGAIGTAKGSVLVSDVAKLALAQKAPIDFVVLGAISAPGKLPPNVKMSGAYVDDELGSLIEAAALDVIWFPAVWPETYCYTLSAALRGSLPIVAFDLGAVAERLRAHGRGHLLAMTAMLDPECVLRELIAVAGAHRDGRGPQERPLVTPPVTYADPLRTYYGL